MNKSVLVTALATILSALFMYPNYDADLGWHLRYGQLFWQAGRLVKENIFSTQLADYVWANHSWLYDVIAYKTYELGNFTLLSILSGALIAASFLLIIWPVALSRLGFWCSLVIYYFFVNNLFNNGLRSQLFSLFLTALLWRLINWHKFHRAKKLLPIVFIVWANLHGQFIVGLGLLALSTVLKWLKKDSGTKGWVTSLLLSTVATGVTPFGFNTLSTAISHIGSPLVKNIYEWLPLQLSEPLFWFVIVYSIFFFVLGIKKYGFPTFIPYGVLFVLSLGARRMVPFYILTSLFLFNHLVKKEVSQTYQRVGLIGLALFALITLQGRQVFAQSWSRYCQSDILCSEKAVDYMRANKISGKIFNGYRLGGHLIFRYPEVKVFIDGRMTLWETGEVNPFARYLQIVHTQPGWKELFDSEKFDYVVIQPQYKLPQILVQSEQWPIVFQDENILILKNPLPTNEKS